MHVIGQICNANCIHMMTSGMTSQELWMIATDELGNQANQIFFVI